MNDESMSTNNEQYVAASSTLEERRKQSTVLSQEFIAAKTYNKEFSQNRTFFWLEKLKNVPFLHDFVDKIQAKQLSLMEEAALEAAGFDAKTGLLNAAGFNYYVESSAAHLSRHSEIASNEEWAVIFLDINWFKMFNDKLGQSEGDVFIKRVAEILSNSVRNGSDDLVGRHGGEEFVMLLRTPPGECRRVVEGNPDHDGGILDRIADKIKPYREKYGENNSTFIEPFSDNHLGKSLKDLGVGTLSAGIRYYSGHEIADGYKRWREQFDAGQTELDFTTYFLIKESEYLLKHHTKQIAHEKQGDTPIWVTSNPESPMDSPIVKTIQR